MTTHSHKAFRHSYVPTMRDILRAARQCAVRAGFPLRECRGLTLRTLFRDAERDGATVYWGFWSDADLDRRIGR